MSVGPVHKHPTYYLVVALVVALARIPSGHAAMVEVTPSTIHAATMQISKEIDLMKGHLKPVDHVRATPLNANLKPRHAWQLGYMIMLKIGQLRRKQGMEGIAPLQHEPSLHTRLRSVWEQTQRILAELRITKTYFGITGTIDTVTEIQGKELIDVFNSLNEISYAIDALIGEQISPSVVYAETLRINEDINRILNNENIVDLATPPPQDPDSTPGDSLVAAFDLMAEIQRLQRQLGIETTDFSDFQRRTDVVPADVFTMIGMCIAEMQTIKAKIGLNRDYTPPAKYRAGKKPAEVRQLLQYEAAKLRLITLR
jgi:hypothetical protein